MISKIKKFFSYIFFLIFFIILFVACTYSFLVYKPDHGIKFIDKVLLLDYSLKIKSTSSNKNLINPFFIFEEIQINDNENKELVYIPNLKIGVNLIESLIQEYLSLSVLEIDTLKSSQGSSIETFQPFLIKGNKLKISNNTIDISAKGFELLISPNDSKIILIEGNINTFSYTEIKAFIDSIDNKLFYESSHSFDSNELNQINSIDLSSLKDHDIYVDLDTKGYIDFETNQNNRFDRLTFKNSSITTNSEFLIKDINSSVFSDLNKELLGVFKSKLPDQNISGSISYDYKRSVIRTNLTINMGGIIDSNRYFSMDGDEIFRSIMILSEDNFSMNLLSNLSNTNISSSIEEINEKLNEVTETSIFIEDMSSPIYQVSNKHINASISSSGRGYFAFGRSFSENIKNNNHKDGFYIYLDLDNLSLDNIFYDDSSSSNTLLKSIKIRSKEFNFLNNNYSNIKFNITFNDEIYINISGKDLNGEINIDQTNFIKINLKDTNFNFDGINIAQSNLASDISNISLRLIGNNIRTEDDIFQDVDFYILKNKNVLTIDNIKIDSKRLNIGPGQDNQKAYISYNNKSDLYKIKGKYRFDNSSGYFDNLTKYNFDFFETDLNIQWNSLNKLTNLEGKLDFLIKDLNLDTEIPETTFLRALRIFNLNGIFEGLDDVSNNMMNINRASGRFIIGKNRALINSPIIFETDEASMSWRGEISKNKVGELDALDLDLSMRLKISENIPWYAAIFGGVTALAGGVVIENIFEDTIENASTINFQVFGTIDKPNIRRLD